MFCQLVHPDSLNYHFVVATIFLRSINERAALLEYLLQELNVELRQMQESNRNIILTMSLLLKAGEGLFHSQPVRLRVKQLLRDTLLCTQALSI